MIVLGICGGHDANWCVFKDGKLLGAFEKERFSRIRHDDGFIMDYVDDTLNKLGISHEEVSMIATSEANFKGTDPGLKYIDKKLYNEPDQWVEMQVDYHGRKIPCFAIPHHLCHAAYSYYASNENDCAVLTWDGGGDFYTTNAYTSTSISFWQNGRLKWLERIGNSDLGSLWHIYSKVIFHDPFAAGKLMGLAAKGSDDLYLEFKKYAMRPVRGILSPVFSIKNCWPDEDSPLYGDVNSWELTSAHNIAYAVQRLTIEAGVALANKAYDVTNANTLCLGGGCALNGYLNTEIAKTTHFQNVFIPPSVHDGGLSIGSALFLLNHILHTKSAPISEEELVFNGLDYSDDTCLSAITKQGLSHETFSPEDLISIISDEIIDGKVVAWYEGKSEHGPRALGHRSILADARIMSMKDRINNTIKFREPFRPIAPLILESDISLCTTDISRSPFMMHIVKTNASFINDNPSAIHIDGTARIQTVKDNCSTGKILKAIKERNNGYVLLNTSFNCREPIVETPYEAISTFMKVPIDILCMNNKFLVKRK